jgi:hypothetical protein
MRKPLHSGFALKNDPRKPRREWEFKVYIKMTDISEAPLKASSNAISTEIIKEQSFLSYVIQALSALCT